MMNEGSIGPEERKLLTEVISEYCKHGCTEEAREELEEHLLELLRSGVDNREALLSMLEIRTHYA
ncbi:hypothetical protein [Mesorhizobium sp. B2-8-9]|uniref:hypothetical protein n=1 Tax=Mesorhizobium sp. B2-8-9 TaxID=2589899 RepID=UPI00112EEF65|nr:hypothetical protein [Mesorhizobium sp. B2-8-9]TPI72567.1 hypothetical protein FJ423_27285 [Mesorhizobium sp. B2-8-9]